MAILIGVYPKARRQVMNIRTQILVVAAAVGALLC